MGHRRGRGQILTADQLADRLAVPCYYILQGKAQAAFPETSVPGPSSFVQVVLIGGVLQEGDATFFPVTVNWRQWNTILVPILEDERWVNYQGGLGATTEATHGGIPQTTLGPGVLSGMVEDEIELLRDTIRLSAIIEGYGSPGQEAGGSC